MNEDVNQMDCKIYDEYNDIPNYNDDNDDIHDDVERDSKSESYGESGSRSERNSNGE